MSILVIDNFRLHIHSDDAIKVETFGWLYNNESLADFDSWVSLRLKDILGPEQFDLIVLPYSLTKDYADYSGLRCAMHIRLDRSLGNTKVPILFVGPDFNYETTYNYECSSLLYSPLVFTNCNIHCNEDLKEWYSKNIGEGAKSLTEHQYESFVNRQIINAPDNLDSRHSVANEWGALRMSELLNIEIAKSAFTDQLFYKLMRAKIGDAQRFNTKWRREHPGIGTIKGKGKKLLYIDDEYSKGWEIILNHISQNSDIELLCYKDFDPSYSKNELIDRILKFVDSNPSDCYLIDLRLHEDDTLLRGDEANLSGQIIIKHLLDPQKGNRGNRIIVFSASNKAWNQQQALESGVFDYVIKESPELLYDRNRSYICYCNLATTIEQALNQSYISDYVRNFKFHPLDDSELTALLNNLVDLLILDKTPEKKHVLPSLTLILNTFIETYIDGHFRFDGDKLMNGNECISDIFQKVHILKGNRTKVLYTAEPCLSPSEYEPWYPSAHQDSAGRFKNNTERLIKSIAALHYYYDISENIVNVYLRARYVRNHNVAHIIKNTDSSISCSLADIDKIVREIIFKIIPREK